MKKHCVLTTVIALLVALPGMTQVEEEDLDEPGLWEELTPAFDAGMKLFKGPDQADSVERFDEFLAGVQLNQAYEEPPPQVLEKVVQAHYMKAQAKFNLDVEVTSDLLALLALEPNFAMDRGLVSSKLVDLYEALQREHVGRVDLRVDPPDARVSASGWEADEGRLVLPTGPHRIVIERNGYSPFEEQVEVLADRTVELEVVLERSAAVITARTFQEGVDLYIDNRLRGSTKKPLNQPTATALSILDDLAIGSYEIDFRKEGFRSQLVRFDVPELADYMLNDIVLIPTSATISFTGLPESTVIRVNGDVRTPNFAGVPTLKLPPGDYLIELEHRALGLFETRVALADGDEIRVPVRLRPALTFLGVLGNDENAAADLLPALGQRLQALDNWALIDRSHLGDEILSASGLSTAQLRSFAQQQLGASIAWKALQTAAADRVESSIYVLAILSNDLLAETAEIFVWPAPPLPSRADTFQIPIRSLEDDPNLSLLDESILEQIPRLGATIVDSAVHGHPVVVEVTPGAPASRAGLAPGDEIIQLEDVEITSAAQLRDEIRARIDSHARVGRTVSLRLASETGTRSAALAMELVYRILSPRDTGVLYSAAAQELALGAASPELATPKWIMELNQGLVFLHGNHPDAVQQLRRVVAEAPEDSPFGPQTAKYFLGLALLGAGSEFNERARGYLAEAAAIDGGRLFHIDGPSVSPRARARLTRGR